MQEIEEKQMEILNRINSVQSAVDGIEKDIYEDDENYEFEIVCPYCEHEFIIDANEDQNAIECPECKNIIELDWSGDTNNDIESYHNLNKNIQDEDDDM